MAVANPQNDNLAPAYGNIIDAIKQRTQIAANQPPGPLANFASGLGKGIGQGISSAVSNKQDVEKQRKLQAIEVANKKILDDYNKVKLSDSDKKNLKNIFVQSGIDEKDADAKVKELGDIHMELAKKEEYLRLITESHQRLKAMDELRANIGKPGYPTAAEFAAISASPEGLKQYQEKVFSDKKPNLNLKPGKDESSDTGYSYFSIDPATGQSINTGVAAPKPSGGGGQTPEKRQDALRNEFNKKVKALDFQRFSNAYQQALRAEGQTEHSPATDARLLFLWAKMNDPTGRLSDEDFKRSVEIGTYGDTIKKAVNRIDKGSVLADGLRQKIVDEIKANYKQADEQISQIEDEHRVLADSEGLDFQKTISPVRPVITKIMSDPKTNKKYKVQIKSDGTKKIIGEVKDAD